MQMQIKIKRSFYKHFPFKKKITKLCNYFAVDIDRIKLSRLIDKYLSCRGFDHDIELFKNSLNATEKDYYTFLEKWLEDNQQELEDHPDYIPNDKENHKKLALQSPIVTFFYHVSHDSTYTQRFISEIASRWFNCILKAVRTRYDEYNDDDVGKCYFRHKLKDFIRQINDEYKNIYILKDLVPFLKKL